MKLGSETGGKWSNMRHTRLLRQRDKRNEYMLHIANQNNRQDIPYRPIQSIQDSMLYEMGQPGMTNRKDRHKPGIYKPVNLNR